MKSSLRESFSLADVDLWYNGAYCSCCQKELTKSKKLLTTEIRLPLLGTRLNGRVPSQRDR